MSKSIKFKNNTYIDSSSISHKRQLLNSILETKTIYDSGSNSNGSWIRFNEGTMICYGTRTFSIVADYAVGAVFYNQNGVSIGLGNYPISFIDTPICVLGGGSGSLNYIEHNYSGGTSIGWCWFFNPTKRTQQTIRVSFIAIGKWK